MDIVDLVWRALQDEISAIKTDIQTLTAQSERAEVAENIPASTLADAPLAADGGLADGVSFATLRWINDGRKPTEGAGAGTGCLAVYDSASDTWLNTFDYSAVTT